MEDKHIYSTSFLSKLHDKFNDFGKEIRNIIQDLKPKRIQKKSPTVPLVPAKTEITQTPITIAAPEAKTKKPQIKIPKEEKPKKEKVKKYHYRKLAKESIQKTLVFSLLFAIITIFGVGTYLSHKDTLILQNPALKSLQTQNLPTTITTSDWTTYTNQMYGFSLKYPQDYIYKSLGPNYFQSLIEKGEEISGTIPPTYETIIFEKENNTFLIKIFHPQNEAVWENYDFIIDGGCGSQFAKETLTDKIVSFKSLKSRYRIQKNENKMEIYYCLLNKSHNLITVSTTTTDEKKEVSEKLLSEILSTFKLADIVCVDSDSYCLGKPNGANCNFGVWCDEQGNMCGGQSCIGLSLGKCIDGKCISQ